LKNKFFIIILFTDVRPQTENDACFGLKSKVRDRFINRPVEPWLLPTGLPLRGSLPPLRGGPPPGRGHIAARLDESMNIITDHL
jgi:hypothetical protein